MNDKQTTKLKVKNLKIKEIIRNNWPFTQPTTLSPKRQALIELLMMRSKPKR